MKNDNLNRPERAKELIEKVGQESGKVLTAPVRVVSNHLFGEKHHIYHRMFTGFLVMILGVIIAKTGEIVHGVIAHYFVDIFGYFLHGIGAAPFVEKLIEKFR